MPKTLTDVPVTEDLDSRLAVIEKDISEICEYLADHFGGAFKEKHQQIKKR